MDDKKQTGRQSPAVKQNTVQKDGKPKKKKKKGSAVFTIILIAILLVGAGIMAYPSIADWWNSYHQSRAIADFVNVLNETDPEVIEKMFADALAYNSKILQKANPFIVTEEDMAEYMSLLDLSGTGMIGYIQIESIDVNLPIYHTTSESVLQTAVGHMEWSSLPVGGSSTHALLSGHRGLPSARLFTDLDRVNVGDIFTVTVLTETLTYQIDQILIVEPDDVSDLMVVSGEDYCTLITCTPYGINTHRMLVRGTRIETAEQRKVAVITGEALRIPNYIAIPAVAVPMLFILLLASILFTPRKRKRLSDEEILSSLQNKDIKTQNADVPDPTGETQTEDNPSAPDNKSEEE